jgi:class 3 adenylate cyclase/tetratricopeptide (TPR) repeat protein
VSDPGRSATPERLDDPAPLALGELLAMASGLAETEAPAEAYRGLGDRLLKAGEALLAYDLLSRSLERWPGDLRLRQLMALALVRSGAVERAQAVLVALRAEGHEDEETLGLLARTHKGLADRAADSGAGRDHLARASEAYGEAYRRHARPWSGINAATTALLLGKTEQAQQLARDVRERCLALPEADRDAYWTHATLGESALILGDRAEAERHYRSAAALGKDRLADLGATRRQARRIAARLGQPAGWLEECFHLPRVVTFVGHMIDRPDRPRPRFPPQLEPAVAREIATSLDALDAGVGYAGAACGGDILFLEAMLARGAEIRVVLPFAAGEFAATSVDVVPGGDWRRRFERVLARAAQVVVVGERGESGHGVEFEYGNLVQDGLALLRARMVDAEFVPLALWDGRAGDGAGGSHSRVERWRGQGYAPRVIDLTALAGQHGVVPPAIGSPASATATVAPPRIMAILFGDAVGFSKLVERQIPAFVARFLGAIGDLLARTRHAPVLRNTWGDGLFFVFESPLDAGAFALELSALVAGLDRPRLGLPDSLGLRIGLHAGPVHELRDPVTGTVNYFGAHVSRAARIEPISPPGQVYASQSFAALAEAEASPGAPVPFACEYVGQVPLAKGYGTFPMYHVRPVPGRPGA